MIGSKVLVSLLVTSSCWVRSSGQELSTGQDLFDQYGVIFPNGNRNAASHRWATYIIERSSSLEEDTIQSLFSHFCPVSGSPIGALRDVSRRWTVTLPSVVEGSVTGVTYLCCWPCICDTQDWIFVDTKTIAYAGGERQFNFLVIGNPCVQPDAIPAAAPDVTCNSGELEGATFSDNGYVIVGMLHDEGNATTGNHADDASEHCQQRAESGYNSGMGQIFIEVAGISPIVAGVFGDTAPLSISGPSDSKANLQSSAVETSSHEHHQNQSNDDVPHSEQDGNNDGLDSEQDLSRASPPHARLALFGTGSFLAIVSVLYS